MSRRDEPPASPLRLAREASGRSLKRAGADLGVSYAYLSKIENGLSRPSDELVGRMATTYGLSEDDVYAALGRLPPDLQELVTAHAAEAIVLLRGKLSSSR